MAHPSQHLLRCVYVVHQGNVEVVEVSMLLVCWAPIMEMLVEASVCFLSDSTVIHTLVPAVAWELQSQFAPVYMHFNIIF